MCVVGARALSTRGRGFLLPRSQRLGMDGVLSVVDGGLPDEETESRLVFVDPAQLDRRMDSTHSKFGCCRQAMDVAGYVCTSYPPKSGGYPVYPVYAMPCSRGSGDGS